MPIDGMWHVTLAVAKTIRGFSQVRLQGLPDRIWPPTTLLARSMPSVVTRASQNRLAHYALAAAALDKARTVSAAHVERARGELNL